MNFDDKESTFCHAMELVGDFLNTSSGQFDRGAGLALEKISKFFDTVRVMLAFFSTNGEKIDYTIITGTKDFKVDNSDINQSFLIKELKDRGKIMTTSLEDKTLESFNKNYFKKYRVNHLTLVPIKYRDTIIGFLELDFNHKTELSELKKSFLKLLGTSLGNIYMQQKKEKRLEGLLESQEDLIVRINPEGEFTYVNNAYCKTFGKSRQDLIGNSFQPLVHEEDIEETLKAMKELEKPPYRINIKQRAKTVNGWRWIQWEDYAIKDKNNQTIEIQAVGRDITEQKQYEEKLKNKEQLLCQITETMHDMVCKFDADLNFTYVSPSVKKVLGYTPAMMVGKSLVQFVHPDDVPRIKKLAQYTKENMVNGRLDYRAKHRDGYYIWVEGVGNVLTDDNHFIGYITNVREISERKRLEEKLKKKTDEMEMILDNINTHVYYFKDEITYGYANKASLEFSGLNIEDLQNTSVYDIFEKERADLYAARTKNVFQEKEKMKSKEWIKNHKGEPHYFTTTLVPKLDDQGDVEYLICTSHDITEEIMIKERLEKSYQQVKKLVEDLDQVNRDLLRSQELFKVNFEEANIGMTIESLDGDFIKINDTFARILGYRKEELIGKNFMDITHPDDKDKSAKIFNELVNGEMGSYNFEKRFVNKEGHRVWVNVNNAVVKDEKGRPQYLLGHLEDITEKKQALQLVHKQREELEYNRLRVKFFANVSHELRTPLNLIFSTLQVMTMYKDNKLDLGDDEKLNKYIALIEQNSNRLLKLVNNLIDITKIGSNSFELKLDNYDIVDIVKKIALSTEDYIQEKEREFEFNSQLDSKVIGCDPFNIERILLNLISNAVKFTNTGDKIAVNISNKKGWVRISVKDTGIGIKEDKQNIIFEQFRQADESFTRRSEGSGIGLALVKSLVELHGGQIWVESEYGIGSEFIIELPDKRVENTKDHREQQRLQSLINKIDVEFADIYDY